MNSQNGAANSPTNPNPRGQALVVYATGLGAVTDSGQSSVANATVTAVLNGVEVPVASASLVPDQIGVYQVAVPVPASTPPGLDLPFALKQGDAVSNFVPVSIQ